MTDIRQKLLHEYSVEELLDIMNTTAEKEELDVTTLSEEDQIQNNIIKFLIYYDIKPGKYRISSKNLFKLYKAWSKDIDTSYQKFWSGMNGQFQTNTHIIDKRHIAYLSVNISLAKITKHIEDISPKKIRINKTKNNLKFMEEFLNVHGIKAGSLYVESDVLYYLFDYYNHKKKRKAIGYYTFISMCHLYFSSKQIGFGSSWFGVNEEIKKLITPEWIKTWREGRVKYGYIIRKNTEEKKKKLYTTEYRTEEVQKKKILYPETLPEDKSTEQDKVSSFESSIQSEKQNGTS